MPRRGWPHGATASRACGRLPPQRSMSDQRARLLVAALGFGGCSMPSYDRSLHVLRSWLDLWSGIGHVAVRMARQGFNLRLTRYAEKGWRATLYTTGMEHSPTSATGTAWDQYRRSGASTPGEKIQYADEGSLAGRGPPTTPEDGPVALWKEPRRYTSTRTCEAIGRVCKVCRRGCSSSGDIPTHVDRASPTR
jgi:hypothetical protein